MRKLVGSLLLIFAISFPVAAGHVQVGSGRYCECTPVGNACPCCGARVFLEVSNQETESVTENATSDGIDASLEFELFLMGILTWLRMEA